MTDMKLAEEIEKYGLSPHLKDQIIAALRRGPELDQTYIVDGRGMRLCDCPNESKCQRGFQRTLATAEFSRCLLPIDHRQFNWFRCSFTKRPPSGEMVLVPLKPTDEIVWAICEHGDSVREKCNKCPREIHIPGFDTGVQGCRAIAEEQYEAALSAAEAEGRKG